MFFFRERYNLPVLAKIWEVFSKYINPFRGTPSLKEYSPQKEKIPSMKYLIVGLGNIGGEYHNTRHNIGFNVLDSLAKTADLEFKDVRYGAVTHYKFKGRTFVLLKPNTYMNLSGKAVNYWLQKEKIAVENMMVIVDDLALPFGTLRLRSKGSDAGHNGLKNINQVLGHQNYARLRFGIGDDFHKGQQIDFVLGKWSSQELEQLTPILDTCTKIIQGFATIGVQRTMTAYNTRRQAKKSE